MNKEEKQDFPLAKKSCKSKQKSQQYRQLGDPEKARTVSWHNSNLLFIYLFCARNKVNFQKNPKKKVVTFAQISKSSSHSVYNDIFEKQSSRKCNGNHCKMYTQPTHYYPYPFIRIDCLSGFFLHSLSCHLSTLMLPAISKLFRAPLKD